MRSFPSGHAQLSSFTAIFAIVSVEDCISICLPEPEFTSPSPFIHVSSRFPDIPAEAAAAAVPAAESPAKARTSIGLRGLRGGCERHESVRQAASLVGRRRGLRLRGRLRPHCCEVPLSRLPG